MFIKKEDVIASIGNLKNITHTSTVDNEKKALSFYLILKKIGLNKFNSISKSLINSKKKEILKILVELGATFDKIEEPEKITCLFFTNFGSFLKAENLSKQKKEFFNAGTKFRQLPGRLTDTIDNSLVDTLLKVEKNDKGESFYTFRNDVENFVVGKYNDKIEFTDVATWIYRFHEFENDLNFKNLKKIFINEYNLTENEFFSLFKFNNNKVLNFEKEGINGREIRKEIGITISEIKNNESDLDFLNINKLKINTSKIKNTIGGGSPLIDRNELKRLLDQYKQIILTGVPGTGKSYFTKELESDYKVFRVQFHPNYTYQDFILGKTLKNNNLEYELGAFLEVVNHAEANEDEKVLLVVDEINRGDISSIFGELIYLLDRNGSIKVSKLSEE